jgi:hypothetical protein
VRGRKPKLTWQVQQEIVGYLRTGAYLETAASAVGIHRTTLFRWLKKGEEASRGRYHDFYRAVSQAQSEFEIRSHVTILKAGQVDWKAAAWGLERRFPERYSRQFNAGMRAASEQLLDHLQSTLTTSEFTPVLKSLEGQPPPGDVPPNAQDVRKRLLKRIQEFQEEAQRETKGHDPKDASGKG